MILSSKAKKEFIAQVWSMGRAHDRSHLPWRFIDDAYAIYVSEVMLQQTQVSRVLKFWPAWIKAFPSMDALAAASKSDVLERWQGLGYNRRALSMKNTAEICSAQYAGKLPQNLDELCALPGIGPATAAGIMAFAHNRPALYLETNVRAVYIHHFFADAINKVSDAKLYPLLDETLDKKKPREWYYALLDYGAYLKSVQPNPTRKAAAYTQQSRFEGSTRQKRSFIVREVLAHPGISVSALSELLNAEESKAGRGELSVEEFEKILTQLESEGFFTVSAGICCVQ